MTQAMSDTALSGAPHGAVEPSSDRRHRAHRTRGVIAWILVLTPVLNTELWVYSWKFDPVVRTLQLAGLLVIAAAAVGVWGLWRISRLESSRFGWVRNAALAAALVGVVWIGFVGQLIGFNLNY